MTGYLARFCARRPWTTILVWVALVAVATLLNLRLLDSALTTESPVLFGVESTSAEKLLEERLQGPEPIVEFVIVQSETLTVEDAAFQEKVESLHQEVVDLGSDIVSAARHYYQDNDGSLVSADGDTTYIPLVMTGDLSEAEGAIENVLHIVEEADAEEGFRVLLGGRSSISHEINEISRTDLETGERIGVPIALIVLLVLFGAFVAALMPLGLAVVAIGVALGATAVIGQAFEMVFAVTLLITMIGLATGIDYSLLMISRFREELGRGIGKIEAVERSGATAGLTVVFSGVTVMVSLSGLALVPELLSRSLAIGAILVVAVALLATMTLLPAALSLLGTRINLLSLPFFQRESVQSPQSSGGGFWGSVTRLVTRHPLVSVVLAAAPMIALIYVFFDIETGLSGVENFPEGAQTKEAFLVLEEEFSFGLLNPAEVVVDGDMGNPQVLAAIEDLRSSISQDPRFPIPAELTVHPPQDLAQVMVFIPGDPRSREALDRLEALRGEHIPSAFDGVPANVLVAGESAVVSDFLGVLNVYTPIVIAYVLGISFVILMLVFRSIVIPVKAVVMNLLSVGATYGLMVLVFQKGVGTDLLGFQHVEVIDAWIPLFLFCILFGLSMDYHVFLLSRIREHYDETGNNTLAVTQGLRDTTKLITGAALIMVVVFSGFAAGQATLNQQVGFGLAVAIFLDATLVRTVLVPASMELLGGRNWYLPSWLRWLPRLHV